MTKQRPRAPVHEMTPSLPRILAAISFVIDEAATRGQSVTQYDIVKSLFLADRGSLNRYGRPITYDNYVAMKDGPVPSLAYNLLKNDAATLRRCQISLPWKHHRAPAFGSKAHVYSIDSKAVDTETLAPSDKHELKNALTVVKSLGFQQVLKLTHDDQAYVEAWDPEGAAKSYRMSYSLLFEVPNESLASDLAFLSKHL